MCHGGTTDNDGSQTIQRKEEIGTDYTYKHVFVWRNVAVFVLLHIFGAIGLYKLLTGPLSYMRLLWAAFFYINITESIAAGAHRYYAHRCFKASPVLRAYFIIFFTIAGQNSIFTWVRDHRLHHRYSDTDGDPHNANRGFFFCHMGWLMMKKHPTVVKLGRSIDMSDLKADPWVMWQYKNYYAILILLQSLTVLVPVYYGESWLNSLFMYGFLRYITTLHITWLINSFAHFYGNRPYDKNLRPVESWYVSFWTLGEGWHNYHHAFPWDYKASELGMPFNVTGAFINLWERLGLVYDLKTASSDVVEKRILRTGDGTYRLKCEQEAVSPS